MGAGILPTTIYKGKLYFLFGKENKYEESAPGFSDFGGGTDKNETYLETAIREAGEELTGFLGNDEEIRKMLTVNGTYNLEYQAKEGHSKYRMHIFPLKFNPWLPYYYNNNQQFLQKYLPEDVFKTTKIFEKAEIRWICIDELKKMRPKFRSYFQNIIDLILQQKNLIFKFILKSKKKNSEKNKKTKRERNKNNKRILNTRKRR
jgi:8-oxo-dGTP pyrophosphatase MutT (NUDIX family)